jgi:hypothetical protein
MSSTIKSSYARFHTPTLGDSQLHYILGCDSGQVSYLPTFRRNGLLANERVSQRVIRERECESESQESPSSSTGVVTSGSQIPLLLEGEAPFQNT